VDGLAYAKLISTCNSDNKASCEKPERALELSFKKLAVDLRSGVADVKIGPPPGDAVLYRLNPQDQRLPCVLISAQKNWTDDKGIYNAIENFRCKFDAKDRKLILYFKDADLGTASYTFVAVQPDGRFANCESPADTLQD
jgi:hypothetical protein